MADIIKQLLQRSHRTLVQSSFGLLYPQVYRITPYAWDFDGLPDNPQNMRPAASPWDQPYYSFDESGSNMHIRWSRVKATPILGLDDKSDSGWIFVRHHKTSEEANGYYEGLKDFFKWSDAADYDISFAVTRTTQGFFTLHRRVTRRPQDNRLAIYVAIHPDAEKPDYHGEIDEFQIVLPDGSISTDSNKLFEDMDD
ncbi:MAG TPA: hypothetical protein VJB97_01480 [Candidatus Paceibacterota bacterium]